MFLTSDNKLKVKWLKWGGAITLVLVLLGVVWFDKPLYLLMRHLDSPIWKVFDRVFDVKMWLILTGLLLLLVYAKKTLDSEIKYKNPNNRFKINGDVLKKSFLYPLPLTLSLALFVSSDLAYKFYLVGEGVFFTFWLAFLICVIRIGCPILLALGSNTKNKAPIIFLDLLSFLPFGIILYTVSFIWAVIEAVKLFSINIRKNHAFLIFSSVLSAGIVAQIIKVIVGRFRPIFFEALDITGFRPFSFEWAFNSMPSGHSAATFAGLVMVGMLVPKYKPLTWALAIIVGASRIACGAHWPTDVILGAFIGMVAADLIKWWAYKHK